MNRITVLLLLSFLIVTSAFAAVPDFDNSGTVDLPDLVTFASAWLTATTGEENLDGIGTVDMADYAIFSQWWQQAPGNPPTAVDDSYTVTLATGISVSAPGVLDNDNDPDGDPLSASLLTNAKHGVVTLNSDGSFTYIHNPDYEGPDSFTYKSTDGSNDSNIATVNLTVNDTSTPPPVISLGNDGFEDPVGGGDISASGDWAEGGDTSKQAIFTATFARETGDNGVWLKGWNDNVNAHFYQDEIAVAGAEYTLDAGFKIEPNFRQTGNINLELIWLNGSGVEISRETLDIDAAILNNSVYTHKNITATSPSGTATVRSQISWSTGNQVLTGQASAMVDNVSIAAGSSIVVFAANNDKYTTPADTALDIAAPGVLGNDIEPLGNPINAILVSDAVHGSVALNPNGSFTYTPDAGYMGPDYFTYKANNGSADSNVAAVNIDVVNSLAPVANDENYYTYQDIPINEIVPGILGNDVEPQGLAMTAVLVDDVSHGSLTLNPNGSFVYTPDAGFNGTDSFTYKADNGGYQSQLTTVTIDVASNMLLNSDFEIGTPGGWMDANWDCANWNREQVGGSDINIWLTDNSYYSYLGAGNQAIATRWSNWRVYQEFTASAGQSYTMSVEVYNDKGPTNHWNGDMSIEWLNASDVLIGEKTSIAKYNSPTDPQDQWVLMLGSAVAPAGTAKGRVSYKAESGAGSNRSLLFFDNAGAFNSYDMPTANDDYYDINVNGSLSIAADGILHNDSSPVSSILSVIQLSDVGHGTLAVNADGSFDYTPTAGYDGSDSFTYRIFDGVSYSEPATVTMTMRQADATDTTTSWTSGVGSPVTSEAVSKLAGMYAVASTNGDSIEIRDIREDVLHTITAADIQSAAAGIDMAGSTYGPCSLAFTPSGRQLFIGVCSASGAGDKDAVLAYHLNLKTLRKVKSLVIAPSLTDTQPFGMAHYKGQLFVGTSAGNVERYTLEKNSVTATHLETISVPGTGGIRGIDVDEIDKKMYISTKDNLCRIDVSTPLGASAEVLYSSGNIGAIGFGRAYGASDMGGMYFIEGGKIMFASNGAARAGNTISPSTYMNIANATSLSATACGKLFAIVNGSPMMISDTADTRMGFEDWVQDEFDQYVVYAKSTCWPDGQPEGWVTGWRRTTYSSSYNGVIQPGGGYIALYLMLADQINGDTEAQDLIRTAQIRGAGLHPDGITTPRSVDGWVKRWHDPDTGIPSNMNEPHYMPFGTDTMILAANLLRKYYPNDAAMQEAVDIQMNAYRRQGDFLMANITAGISGNKNLLYWTAEDTGPLNNASGGINELQICLEYAAAQDPLSAWLYDYAVYDRDRLHMNDYTLTNERVATAGWPSFIPQWNFSYQQHLRTDPVWRQEFYNYLSLFSAWTDDNGAPYLTVFSAGPNPHQEWGYLADSYNNHPGDIIHFPGVVGFSMLGDTSPSVGAYFAYREGLRSTLEKTPGSAYPDVRMLTRWSIQDPTWINPNIAHPDAFFGIFGLAEILSPGSIEAVIGGGIYDAYVPGYIESTTGGGNVQLDFSDLVPRRVFGSNDGVNWIPYGFNMTPFVFDAGVSYTHYDVTDPEGQPLNLGLENMDFEGGTTGWTKSGDYTLTTTTAASDHIVGTSAELVTDGSDASTSITQTFNVTDDFDDTRYIFRGVGRSLTAGAAGRGSLRITWDADSNEGNGTISSLTSSYVDNSNPWVEFEINGVKPAAANYVHLAFVAEKVTSTTQRFVFDALSIVRVGTEMPSASSNGGFETGTTAGWTLGGVTGNAKITSGGDVLEGTYSLWLDFPSIQLNNSTTIQQDFDITGDPEGTRYMVRFKLDPVALNASEPVLTLTASTASDSRVPHKLTLKSDMDYIDYGLSFRKRADETNLNINLTMTRTDGGVSTTDKVIFDSLEVVKEWPQHDN